MKQDNPFEQFLLVYGPRAGEDGPLRFVKEVLGASPDDWQEDGLRAFGRGERQISVKSCHGPGKTAWLAWLVVYSLCCRFPQKTVATAPSKGQLEDALVAEVNRWFQQLPAALQANFEAKKNRIEFKAAPDSSFFSARTAREENPEALQGVHSENVLLIADEASGVHEKIFEASVGSMSGGTEDVGGQATMVLASNPVRTSGLFFDSHNRLAASWYRIHVTGVKHENHDVKKHGYYSRRVSPEFVKQVADTYGEQSNAYRVRALGEFPLGDLDTVIPHDLLVAAQDRDIIVPPNSPEVWGLDVARFGDDDNALVRRNRLEVLPLIETWQGKDLMQTTGRIKKRWDETQPHLRPGEILIDVIGMGAGVVDRLLELGLPARGVNVSETQGVDEQYRNLRTELWFKCKDWLAGRAVKMPKECTCKVCKPDPLKPAKRDNHVALMEVELLAQRLDYTSTGKMMCYPKSQMKKLLKGRSPNVADALMLTFASEIAVMIHGNGVNGGWGGAHAWNKPIRLGRAVV